MSVQDIRSIVISFDMADRDAAPKVDLGTVPPSFARWILEEVAEDLAYLRRTSTIIHADLVVLEHADEDDE